MKMEYWFDTYGKQSEEFIDGVIAGVKAFAVWNNGRQVVGIERRDMKDEIKDIKKELGEDKSCE